MQTRVNFPAQFTIPPSEISTSVLLFINLHCHLLHFHFQSIILYPISPKKTKATGWEPNHLFMSRSNNSLHRYPHLPSFCYDGRLGHGQLLHLCSWSIHIFLQGFCSNMYATFNLQHLYILLCWGVPTRICISYKKFQHKNNSHLFCLFFITLIQSLGLILINYLQHLHHLFYFMQASLNLIFRLVLS